jgi:chain length determinant protein tyrosine kinase EpsG
MARFQEGQGLPSGGAPAEVEAIGKVLAEVVAERAPWASGRAAQIEAVARERGMRFGDAAVALGAATVDEVMQALARQFRYPAWPSRGRSRAGSSLSDEAVMLAQPYSPQAEAFRALRSQLIRQLFRPGQTGQALAVTSPDTGDGKTFLSGNLAIALAQMGGRTLLVDADLRGPRVHEVVRVDNDIGLSTVLSGRADLQCIQPVPVVNGLFVLPGGALPPNPLELIERPAFASLLRHLAVRFDHVVVDTPAAVYGSDAQAVADRCAATLVVARRHASRLVPLQRLTAALSQGPSRLVGVFLNEFHGRRLWGAS